MGKPWNTHDDAYVLHNYGGKSAEELARTLKRTPDAVRKRFYTVSRKSAVDSELEPELIWVMERANTTVPQATKMPTTAGAVEVTSALKVRSRRGGNAYQNTKTGYRPDLGIVLRSGWEANFARVLKSYKVPFQFEPTIFTYPVKKGNKGYTPDFYLLGTEEWVEVKGYMDKNSMIKLRRFKRYYPEHFANLTMIIGKSSKAARDFCVDLEVPTVLTYEGFSKVFKNRIAQWEGR